MSVLPDYDKEPLAADASPVHHSKEVEQLKEDNHRLAARVKELEVAGAKLEDHNNELRAEVEHCDEQKGSLLCRVEELTAKLQTSAR